MGQYHTIYNKTKKEYFSIGGAKLIEKAHSPLCSAGLMVLLCNSNGRGGGDIYVEREYDKNYKAKPLKGKKLKIHEALQDVQGRWAGDEIVIQGDYANNKDPSFIPQQEWEEVKNITEIVLEALRANEEFESDINEELNFTKRMRA